MKTTVVDDVVSARKTRQMPREFDALLEEIRRAEISLADLLVRLRDRELDLALSMRLSIQQKELRAYLHGLRYAIGEWGPLAAQNGPF